MLLLSHRYLKGSISVNQEKKNHHILIIDWIIDIFLQRIYLKERKISFPFKLKIAITRSKKKIFSSSPFANILFLITKKILIQMDIIGGIVQKNLLFRKWIGIQNFSRPSLKYLRKKSEVGLFGLNWSEFTFSSPNFIIPPSYNAYSIEINCPKNCWSATNMQT